MKPGLVQRRKPPERQPDLLTAHRRDPISQAGFASSNEDDMAKAAKKQTAASGTPQAHQFQAEVAKLLHLMVHSVYSDRDVFLRELISNAADALDKLRYEAIAKPELLGGDAALNITITPDKKAKTLTVADNGIGMSRDELIDNLGTIAKSGTQAFVETARQAKGDVQPDRPVRRRLLFGLHRRQPGSTSSRGGPAPTKPSCGRRTGRAVSPWHPAEAQGARHRDRAPSQGRCARNFSRTGRSKAWSGPIPTTSRIRSCWPIDKRDGAPDQYGQCHLDAAQIRGHGGAAQGILRPYFRQLFRSGADHPLPRRGPPRIYGAALSCRASGPSISTIRSGAAARSSM